MKSAISTIFVILAVVFSATAGAQQGELPKGRPFVILESNVTVLAEAVDELYQEIARLEARIAVLEGGEKSPEQAKCEKLGGTWIPGKTGSTGKCKNPKLPPRKGD